jgi:hypothetical protein
MGKVGGFCPMLNILWDDKIRYAPEDPDNPNNSLITVKKTLLILITVNLHAALLRVVAFLDSSSLFIRQFQQLKNDSR